MTKFLHHTQPVELESGHVLPGVTIAYHTYGKLNANGDNAVWVCHALTANSEVADWWPHTVEEGKFLDPEKYFIVCANTLGSCYGTTGPTSINPATGQPWYADFPRFTIRDIVRLHQILAAELGISQLHALIGASLGGFQALEWALMQPGITRHLLLIATGSHCSPWLAAFNKSMYMAFDCDPTWGQPHGEAGLKAMACARAIALLSYRGAQAYNLTQADGPAWDNMPPFARRAHSYQAYQGEKLCRRFNPYSYYRLCQSADSHDASRGRGTMAQTLGALRVPTLVVAISSDILFPVSDHQEMAALIPGAELRIINSDFAHDGFLIEHQKLDALIQGFYQRTARAQRTTNTNNANQIR